MLSFFVVDKCLSIMALYACQCAVVVMDIRDVFVIKRLTGQTIYCMILLDCKTVWEAAPIVTMNDWTTSKVCMLIITNSMDFLSPLLSIESKYKSLLMAYTGMDNNSFTNRMVKQVTLLWM